MRYPPSCWLLGIIRANRPCAGPLRRLWITFHVLEKRRRSRSAFALADGSPFSLAMVCAGPGTGHLLPGFTPTLDEAGKAVTRFPVSLGGFLGLRSDRRVAPGIPSSRILRFVPLKTPPRFFMGGIRCGVLQCKSAATGSIKGRYFAVEQLHLAVSLTAPYSAANVCYRIEISNGKAGR